MDQKKIKLLITVMATIIIIGGAYFFYQSQDTEAPQQPNNQEEYIDAVDFNLQNEEGKNTYLSDFRNGKPIIIHFWASECGVCVLEMPDFQKLYDDYKDDIHFMMIDSIGALGETKEKGKQYIDDNNYTFPIYYDVNQNAQSAYGVYSFPTTYIINKDFQLVAGGSGRINYEAVQSYLDELIK